MTAMYEMRMIQSSSRLQQWSEVACPCSQNLVAVPKTMKLDIRLFILYTRDPCFKRRECSTASSPPCVRVTDPVSRHSKTSDGLSIMPAPLVTLPQHHKSFISAWTDTSQSRGVVPNGTSIQDRHNLCSISITVCIRYICESLQNATEVSRETIGKTEVPFFFHGDKHFPPRCRFRITDFFDETRSSHVKQSH